MNVGTTDHPDLVGGDGGQLQLAKEPHVLQQGMTTSPNFPGSRARKHPRDRVQTSSAGP